MLGTAVTTGATLGAGSTVAVALGSTPASRYGSPVDLGATFALDVGASAAAPVVIGAAPVVLAAAPVAFTASPLGIAVGTSSPVLAAAPVIALVPIAPVLLAVGLRPLPSSAGGLVVISTITTTVTRPAAPIAIQALPRFDDASRGRALGLVNDAGPRASRTLGG